MKEAGSFENPAEAGFFYTRKKITEKFKFVHLIIGNVTGM